MSTARFASAAGEAAVQAGTKALTTYVGKHPDSFLRSVLKWGALPAAGAGTGVLADEIWNSVGDNEEARADLRKAGTPEKGPVAAAQMQKILSAVRDESTRGRLAAMWHDASSGPEIPARTVAVATVALRLEKAVIGLVSTGQVTYGDLEVLRQIQTFLAALPIEARDMALASIEGQGGEMQRMSPGVEVWYRRLESLNPAKGG